MPVACDDADGDLALALAQRVAAWLKMSAESADDPGELWIVGPDLDRARQAPAPRHDGVVCTLLLRTHSVVGDFGIASEGWGLRWHFVSPVSSLFARTANS